MILYHITPNKNKQSIFDLGLIPKFNRGLVAYYDDWKKSPNVIWLTTDYNFILKTQAGLHWCTKMGPIILEINTENLNLIYINDYEYHCYNIIQPERIKVISDD